MINATQVKSAARWAVGLGAGSIFGVWLKNHGFPLDDSALEVLSATLAAAFMLVWSGFTHTDANTVQRAAEVVPIPMEVQKAAGVASPTPGYEAKIQPVVNELATAILIGLTVLGLVFTVLKSRIPAVPVTTEQVLQSERAYAVVLVGVKNYIQACEVDRSLPLTCNAVVAVLRADVRKSDAVYRVVVMYEDNPPQDVGALFVAAYKALVSTLPAQFIPIGG